MNDLLIDSSAIYADRDRHDPEHARARAFLRSPGVRFHTRREVVWELYALARRRLGYEAAMTTARALLEGRFITVHPMAGDHDERTWNVLAEFRGIGLSHVDATLIVLSRQLRIPGIFSFGSDFTQAGLTVVP